MSRSRLAPSATVPSAAKPKQNSIASGTTAHSAPTWTRTLCTRRPAACSHTASTTLCVSAISCISVPFSPRVIPTIGRCHGADNDAWGTPGAGDYHRAVTEMLTDDDVAALRDWIREQGIGSEITDLTLLAGGTQNIVVGMRVDGRPVVLRRPPAHPRPTSNKTMQREIAVLRTLAGSGVPHPEFICGCEDLDVLGVVFYLMAHVDGFNPSSEVTRAYADKPEFRHDVGIDYA